MKNYYEILEIDPDSDSDQIKKAFRLKSKQYHPDKNQGDPEYNIKFVEVKEAYDVLSNKESRLKYDNELYTQGQKANSNFYSKSSNNYDYQTYHKGRNLKNVPCFPIKLLEGEFEKLILSWLSEGDYTPDDIIDNITRNHNLSFLPYMYMNQAYSGTFEAKLGIYRTYYKKVYNQNTKQYENVAHRVMEYFYRSHQIQNNAHLVGLNQNVTKGTMFEKIEAKFQSSSNDAANIYSLDLSSFDEKQILQPKFSQQDLFETRLKKDLLNIIRKQALSHYNYDYVSYANVNVEFLNVTHFEFFVPYWIFTYRYNESSYYSFVNAFDTTQYGGTRPVDKARKKVVAKINWKYWTIGLGSMSLLTYLSMLIYQGYYQIEDLELNWYSVIIAISGLIIIHKTSRKRINAIKKISYDIRKEKLRKKLESM
ncbi:DnaJ-like protein [Larkinella arboricola]|uniref:DnaJ-like protein n=1 Tax=Larkinella arboricola TaxID=643671 RepID=A0A327WFK4_LARAB|nr:J domain-containing protein [Larkinella arboricola]RAJ89906.1 DnaJ-like protein [Larkinella arboricola]